MISRALDECMTEEGGIDFSRTKRPSDVAINGMALNYASYFCGDDSRLTRLVDALLSQQRDDGGWNWDYRSEAGEPHTTICVLEGLAEYLLIEQGHRLSTIRMSIGKGIEFLLSNDLFMESDDPRFMKLTYPFRYRYDVLRSLEFFARYPHLTDHRMKPALCWLNGKMRSDGKWVLENEHHGVVHVQMESLKQPSRFISLKARHILNVLK
jgi:hypothetical protein